MTNRTTAADFYELEYRRAPEREWQSAGKRSGSVSFLKDCADLQNTDYRIVDGADKVVWEFRKNS